MRRPARGAHILLLLLGLACIPQATCTRAWVYTLVSADHGGDRLLPHFVNYYHQLGMTYRRFLVNVHHDPSKYSRAGLEGIMGICQGYSLECRVWEGEYTAEGAQEHMLRMLDDYVLDPYDWLVAAHVDELQQWPESSLRDFLTSVGWKASYIVGRVIDRAAEGGELLPVQPAAQLEATPALSLFQQFPWACAASKLAQGGAHKVVAYRNFLRTTRDGRRIVSADHARAYFGPCTPGEFCLRSRRAGLDKDLYELTPYAKYKEQYVYVGSRVNAHGATILKPYTAQVLDSFAVVVHRFKWHAGVVDSLRDRLEDFAGDCRLGQEEKDCSPLVPGWREAARAHAALLQSGQVDVEKRACAPVKQDEEVEVDTTRFGLAWEQFDASLNVVSKVRNTVRGDSQTRQAAKLAAGKDSEDKR